MATLVNVEGTRKDLSQLMLHPRFCRKDADGLIRSVHIPGLSFTDVSKEHSFPAPDDSDDYTLVTTDTIERVIKTQLNDMNYTFANGYYMTRDKHLYEIHGIAESMYCDHLVYVYANKSSRSRPSAKIINFVESVQTLFKRELGMYLNVKLIKLEGYEEGSPVQNSCVIYNFRSTLEIP